MYYLCQNLPIIQCLRVYLPVFNPVIMRSKGLALHKDPIVRDELFESPVKLDGFSENKEGEEGFGGEVVVVGGEALDDELKLGNALYGLF